ncbi:MAG: hypothetical protein ACKV2Q_31570 [Planctomycetaceae bacterium]
MTRQHLISDERHDAHYWRVSYLELYGREKQPNFGWTAYGNQVERRLFSGAVHDAQP